MPKSRFVALLRAVWGRLDALSTWLLMGLFWLVVYGPPLVRNARLSLDPSMMCDDVRIVTYHFYHWADPELFANDVLGKYHSDGTSEIYRGLFFLVAKFGDPYEFTKLPPYLLYLVALVGIGVAAHRLGGRVATFIAVTLCLGSGHMLGRIDGMLPRAFAYPILAWLAAALVHGRIRTVALLTILGAGFYPVITAIGGLALAIALLCLPAEDRGSASGWSWRRRLSWLAGTALACALLTAPFTLRMREYGETITPDAIAQYPEAGPGGRQDSLTRPPFAPLAQSWTSAAESTVLGAGRRLVPGLGGPVVKDPATRDLLFRMLSLVTVLGCLRFGFSESRALRRLAGLAAAAGIGYLLANAVTPRLVVPPRYTTYGVPIVAALAVAVAPLGLIPSALLRFGFNRTRLRLWFTIGYASLLLALVGGRTRDNVGLRCFVPEESKPLFAALEQLPKSAVVAGWPEGPLETMPIASLRTPFLTRELHVPYHTNMTLLMRQRMEALVAAYYASDVVPLQRLRDGFGVTHLLVERTRLEAPSRYFKPFGEMIQTTFDRGVASGFMVERLRTSAATYDDGANYVLDLGRLP